MKLFIRETNKRTNNLTSLLYVSVLSKAFGRKWEGRTGDWRRLREEELTKYYSGDQIENNGIGGACSTYGREKRCIQGQT